MNVFSQQLKDRNESIDKQLKMATFNAINRLLASGNDLKPDQKRSILTSYNKFVSLGGSIDDFKKHKSAMQDLISKREDRSIEIEFITAKRWMDIHNRSKEKGIAFNLTLSDMKKLLLRKKCQYSGDYMTLEPSHANSLTIERIDNNEGYTKSNVIAVCYWANNLKSTLFESGAGLGFKYKDIDKISSFLNGVKSKISIRGEEHRQ